MDAQEVLRGSKRNLGVLLNIPGPQAEALEIRGTLRDVYPPPPPVDELIALALRVAA